MYTPIPMSEEDKDYIRHNCGIAIKSNKPKIIKYKLVFNNREVLVKNKTFDQITKLKSYYRKSPLYKGVGHLIKIKKQ